MEVVTLLLGSEGLSDIIVVINLCILIYTGSEKLTTALESAAPEKLLTEEVSSCIDVHCSWSVVTSYLCMNEF